MKIEELVETVKKNKNKSIKSIINTKSYLPYTAKVDLVQSIIKKCSTEVNGITEINELDLYIISTCDIISAYTDLEFGILYWEDYDLLAENQLLNSVVATFAEEYKTVLNMLNVEKETILSRNSIEYQVAGLVNKIESAVDEFVGSMTNKIDTDVDFNMEQFGELLKLIK